jgi:hypothetical protein
LAHASVGGQVAEHARRLATSYGHLVDELVDGLSAATMDQRGGRLDGRPAASCADVGAGPGDRRAPAR